MTKYTMRDASGQLWHDIDDENLSEFLEQYPDAIVVSEERVGEEEILEEEVVEDEVTDEETVVEQEKDPVQIEQEIIGEDINKDIREVNVEVQNPEVEAKEDVLTVEKTEEDIAAEKQLNADKKEQERLRRKLMPYMAERENTMNNYKFMSYEMKQDLLANISEADQTLINQNEWGKLSEDARLKIADYNMKDNLATGVAQINPGAAIAQMTTGYGASTFRQALTAGQTEMFNPYGSESYDQYEKDVENFVTKQKAGEIPTSFLDSRLGTNLIGHEEEEVVPTLSNLYGEYGFRFAEASAGDAVRVYAPNGKDMLIDLDNWTESGDREESLRLKSFLDENKGEYNKRTFEQIASLAKSQEDKINMKQGEYDFFKLDRDLSEADQMEFDALYDEDILNEKREEIDNSIIDFKKKRNQLQLDSNKLTVEWNEFEAKIKRGEVAPEKFEEKRAEFQQRAQEIKAANGALNELGTSQILPLSNAINLTSGYQSIIQEEKGSFLGSMGNYILGIGDSIEDVGLLAEMTVLDLRLASQGVSEEERLAIVAKQQKDLKIDVAKQIGSDNTEEYQAAFDNSVGGGITKAITEMAAMYGAALLTGPAAPIVFPILMGTHVAGGVADEMTQPEFDDVPAYEKLMFTGTIGVINGAIEHYVGKALKLFGPGGKIVREGIDDIVVKPIMKATFSKIAKTMGSKEITKEVLQKATREIIDEGIKKGSLQITKKGLTVGAKGAGIEIGTELLQTGLEFGMKDVYNTYKEEEKFKGLGEMLTKENLIKTAIIAGSTGGIFGTIGGFRSASAANKGKSVVGDLSNKQFSDSKLIYLNKRLAADYSRSLMLQVEDPNNPMTREQADKKLREVKALGGLFKEVDGMGLTIEGEKLAFPLLQRKQQLQKQIDRATDKAIVKKQREEITSINEALEDISLNQDFESAYQRGLTEASERQVASDKGFNVYKTDKEFEAKMKEFGENDPDGFRSASGYRSGAGDIYINDAAARRVKDISVGQHELLHGITAKQMEGRGQADKDQLITDFKKELPKDQLEILDKDVTSSYGKDATSEEYFNRFVDLVVKGDIKQDEGVFTKIGDWITKNILKPLGFKQASFKNGKEVYRFIKGYAKQSRAISRGTQKTFTGDIGDIVNEGVGTKAEGQMSRQTPTVEGVDAKQVQTMIDKVANRAWTRFGKGIPENIREEAGVTRRSYIDSAKSELSGIATKFDPSKAEFDRYMANTGMQRLNSLAKRLGVKSKEEQTTSIDSDKAQQVEAGQDDFKDTRSEREIRQDERSGVKARTKIPKVYDVDTVVESIREKAKGKDFKGKSIKQLKGFGLKEVVDMIARDDKDLAASIFKKIDKNSDLNKGEMLAIQKFINADADFALNSLLEGYTDDFKATGVVNKILEKFYNKRSVRSKTGPGLNIQIKKPNIDLKEFKEAFGIIGRNMADWNQKVVASKGGVSDILKGFVRNLDQVISSQEIREQKIIEGDLENARKLRSGIPQGFFSKFSKDNQSKTLDEILFDIYGTENIDEVKKFQLFGEALRAQLTTNPDAAIEDLIVAVADQLEIKEGFAYEQVIYDVIQDSISKYKIPGLTVGSGPTEVGGAADIEVNFFGQEVGFEAKKNNARFGSVTASYDIDGNLIIKKDYTFDKLLKQMLKSAKPEIDAYIKEGNKIGKRLFGNKYKPMKNITDAMPAEVYDELKNRGFQKKITQTMKIDTDFVSELYWGKGNGTAYIQIQGLGVFYLKDPSGKNIENPLELDVPPFDGNLDLVFSISSNTANNPSTYDNNDLEVRTKNAKGNPAKRALPGSESFRRISLRFQPSKLTGLEKSSLQLDNPASIKKAFGQLSKQNQITELQQGAFESNQELNESTKVLGKFSRNNQKQLIQEFLTTDAALNKANELNPVSKKIRVFDFDDTLATSNNLVFASNGQETIELNAEEFAKQGDTLIDKGYTMDFSDFNTVRDGNQGPLFDIAKKIKDARGNEDLFVLTARSPEAQVAIYNFLKSQGLEFKMENIVGLGDSTGAAKAQWLIGKAAEGFNDFYFADDAINNVDTVKGAMEVLDVKSRVQLAKEPGKFSKQPKAVRDVLNVVDIKSETQQNRPGKFSKQLDGEFNNIIQETTGEPADSTISDIRAKMAGQNKGKRKFWIPYSAEDFTGLIYPLLGKGKKGNAQMKWFKENLFDPFAKGMAAVSASRLQLMDDFRALKKKLNVPKTLKKKSILGFNNEQAVRAFIWNMQGTKIPGITQKETDALVKHVQNDPTLKTFAYEITQILKGDPYAAPKGDWFAGGIQTDLMETLNTTKRAKYLAQWQANADAIFTKENLNKLEALYGSKYREALENSLARMKNGKNRLSGGNRLSNRILDYINGSVGTIMFLNMRSAILQTISSINFINWTDNNPLKAGAALANQGQYWKDFTTLMQSDFLKDRRSGLRLNINESEIADAAKTGKNKAKAVMSYILQKGYAPTQFADSFAIASGGATFYRNRIKTLLKQGMSKAEAETQAMQDFREIAEASQQSSRPDKISQQQSSDLGRIILAFANTPMQYARLQKRAFQDLVSGRGDAKSNVSKIIYYGFVQNLIFNALQQAVFALGFGDDEEAEEKKAIDTANGMVDSILRGLGIAGVGVSVVKNFLLDIYKRSDRAKPDYVDSVYKLLQFSPPISSKISKIRQAAYQFDSKERRQEMIDKGFSLDNPAYDAFAKVVSAATNAPLDRLLLKMDNVEGALSEENDMWQRVAMLAGWPEWQINPKPKNKEKKTYKRPGYNSLKYKKNKTRSKSKSKLKLKRRI